MSYQSTLEFNTFENATTALEALKKQGFHAKGPFEY